MVSWIAFYSDGRALRQGKDVTYGTLDRNGLIAFQLFFKEIPIFTVHLDEDRKLVWALRHEIIPGGSHTKVHLVGWRQKIKGEIIQSIAYVFERTNKNGLELWPIIHLAGKYDRKIHPLFYQSALKKGEAFKGEEYFWSEKVKDDKGREQTITKSAIKQEE